MPLYSSPLQPLPHPAARAAGVSLYCKRDDLLTLEPGSALQGNKARKLIPLLNEIQTEPRAPLLYSFGGAYSNHVSAMGTVARKYGWPVVLFIRGEEVDNPLLQRAEADGARLIRLYRSEYGKRNDPGWLGGWRRQLAWEYNLQQELVRRIPEGGTTWDGMINCGKAYEETIGQLGGPPDYFCLSAGTGGTAAGIIHAADPATRIEVFPALRGDWMKAEITKFLNPGLGKDWAIVPGYDFGGYGKFPAKWIVASDGLAKRADIGEPGLPPLEPIYTAKLFRGVLDRIGKGVYPAGSRVVVLHTGGIY